MVAVRINRVLASQLGRARFNAGYSEASCSRPGCPAEFDSPSPLKIPPRAQRWHRSIRGRLLSFQQSKGTACAPFWEYSIFRRAPTWSH